MASCASAIFFETIQKFYYYICFEITYFQLNIIFLFSKKKKKVFRFYPVDIQTLLFTKYNLIVYENKINVTIYRSQ